MISLRWSLQENGRTELQARRTREISKEDRQWVRRGPVPWTEITRQSSVL